MSFFDKLRTQKLLSFTLILFTLSIGIVIGTLINSGVKAAKDDQQRRRARRRWSFPNPVELSNTFTQIAKQVEPSVVNISTTYLPKAPAQARGGGQAASAPVRQRPRIKEDAGRRQRRHGRIPVPLLRQSVRRRQGGPDLQQPARLGAGLRRGGG